MIEHNKHDKGYKFLLSSKKVFLQLLKSFVKEGWVEQIDEENMILVNKSYILHDFSDKESDLVYKIKVKDQEVIFYTLMELQSSVDFQMPYRLIQYMMEIWREVLKDVSKIEAERKGFKLPVIVPLVLYNGQYNWTASVNFKDYLNGYDIFGEYIIDFKYILIDVNRYSEEELFNLANLIGSVFLIDQKIDVEKLILRLKSLISIVKNTSPDEILMFKNWLKEIALSRFPDEIRKDVKLVLEKDEEVDLMIYNMAETIKEEFDKKYEEGKQEGVEKGIEKTKLAIKMIKAGESNEKIKAATELSYDEIEEIRNSISS